MSEGGGGVWETNGTLRGEYDGPIGPMCPICPADKPHVVVPNEGRAGGWLCEGCMFVFDGTHGESQHPRNQRRREIWAEEIRDRKEAS